jgi:hypothetical protein
MRFLIVLVSFLATSIVMAYPSDKICWGDRVINSSNHTGTVVGFFNDGVAKVLFDGFSMPSLQNIDQLGKGVRCIEDVCVQNAKPDGSSHMVSIVEVFDNGKIRAAFSRYSTASILSLDAWKQLDLSNSDPRPRGYPPPPPRVAPPPPPHSYF